MLGWRSARNRRSTTAPRFTCLLMLPLRRPLTYNVPVVALASDHADQPLGLDHHDAARPHHDMVDVAAAALHYNVVHEVVVVREPLEQVAHQPLPHPPPPHTREPRRRRPGQHEGHRDRDYGQQLAQRQCEAEQDHHDAAADEVPPELALPPAEVLAALAED